MLRIEHRKGMMRLCGRSCGTQCARGKQSKQRRVPLDQGMQIHTSPPPYQELHSASQPTPASKKIFRTDETSAMFVEQKIYTYFCAHG
jgi:hypothetical protein